jgi:hypothetical protein
MPALSAKAAPPMLRGSQWNASLREVAITIVSQTPAIA